ncbi:hypothetical protein [Amycolatopsis sp. A1MSW2902]|uniref:hypothetical protein n=1 Tax=Amycolatopsis sp. A1MSW2902 TaxID=687413 RepID=UPI00307F4184
MVFDGSPVVGHVVDPDGDVGAGTEVAACPAVLAAVVAAQRDPESDGVRRGAQRIEDREDSQVARRGPVQPPAERPGGLDVAADRGGDAGVSQGAVVAVAERRDHAPLKTVVDVRVQPEPRRPLRRRRRCIGGVARPPGEEQIETMLRGFPFVLRRAGMVDQSADSRDPSGDHANRVVHPHEDGTRDRAHRARHSVFERSTLRSGHA